MSLVGIKDILVDARKNKYAVPAFDVSDYRFAKTVVSAAEDLKAPVIIMGLKSDLTDDEFVHMAGVMRKLAEEAAVPVCVHLDHATDFELIKWAIDMGYSSVMIDASRLPLEENIKVTKQVTDYAHAHNVTVEAELGHVGDGIVGSSASNAQGNTTGHASTLTDPDELKYFVEKTNVDCLAVAIGTSHGVYKEKPRLDIELCKRINEVSSVPLVMHGGSGTPKDAVLQSIQNGIAKINIYSEICNAFFTSVKKCLDSTDNMSMWQSAVFTDAKKALYEAVCSIIKEFGADGKAGGIKLNK